MSEWKEIPNCEGRYEVSNFGKIRNKKTRRILKPYITEFGYFVIALYNGGDIKKIRLHRLVAEVFIPNPENKTQVNHIDGNKTNNRVSNLEWVNQSENIRHCYKNIRKCGGGGTPKPVLCVETGVKYSSISAAASSFNVTNRAIQRGLVNNKMMACGYHWRFI